ncbi:MAG: helix-turn-helix transcriptional regulator [Alphaproteobacteria bacterium]|nr:helix-turn-helix transcriptional regulator [Alphaproteobacteria bacterium]
MPGSTLHAPPRSLAAIVEAIWQVDMPDGAAARAQSVRLLPTASSIMVVHYRAPIRSDRRHYEQRPYRAVITGVQRETVTLAPSGPTGSIVVRFRPGAAGCVFGDEMQHFTDANIELDDVVGAPARDRLQDALRDAPNAAGRLDIIEGFLLARLRHAADPRVMQAIAALRRSPGRPIGAIAREGGLSARQLERGFLRTAGAAPKQMARTLRAERAIAARHHGAAWADIALACGFTDQAHMIRDFRALSGMTPDRFMREALAGAVGGANRKLALSGFYNTALLLAR